LDWHCARQATRPPGRRRGVLRLEVLAMGTLTTHHTAARRCAGVKQRQRCAIEPLARTRRRSRPLLQAASCKFNSVPVGARCQFSLDSPADPRALELRTTSVTPRHGPARTWRVPHCAPNAVHVTGAARRYDFLSALREHIRATRHALGPAPYPALTHTLRQSRSLGGCTRERIVAALGAVYTSVHTSLSTLQATPSLLRPLPWTRV
jgi:hypothetical protein